MFYRALISYEGKTGPASQKLKLHSTGSGGFDELNEQLQDEVIGFALLRETDKVWLCSLLFFPIINLKHNLV